MSAETKKEEVKNFDTAKAVAGQEQAKAEDKRELADFKVGDTIRVYVRIEESEEKFRLQPFEGLVIRRRGSGINRTFTVRKISYGEGVERVFSIGSPSVQKIEIVKKGKVKKSKLYYLRSLKGKAYKVEEEKE